MSYIKGVYSDWDVTMLIEDLSGKVAPVSLAERDRLVKGGAFERSIMIEEYPMSQEYEECIMNMMDNYTETTAKCVASLADQLMEAKGNKLVLVSIIRAGIPVGILLKRYIKYKYNIDVPHYAVSLVKGLDKAAMKIILDKHKPEYIQFIDGWTGKGTVTNELVESAKEYPGVDASLAVLSDVTGLAKYAGIREDVAIPSAPMNACATGLVSITILREAGTSEMHGAMMLDNLRDHDHSIEFLNMVESKFKLDFGEVNTKRGEVYLECPIVAKELGIDMKKLNPGINEAARAILRRDLKELLVADKNDREIQMIKKLAEIKGVPVREYRLKAYKAISVAK